MILHNAIPLRALARFFFFLLATMVVGGASLAQAEPATLDRPAKAEAKIKTPVLGEQWVRIARDRQGKPLALEVAIVRYVPAKNAPAENAKRKDLVETGPYVDLIGAIHIGDRRYYRQLNKQFETYDALLYELVAPEGTIVPKGHGTSNSHPLGAMQNAMKSMLNIEHQLEQVDYTCPNFVHADFSPTEFAQSMQDRNESFLQMYFRMLGQAVAQQSEQAAEGESLDMDILTAFFSNDRPRRLKIALAKQFENMESLLVGLSGPEGSTLITERNKRALEVLAQQQATGKQKIGIFYGAGHFSDMHDRLVDEFGMQAVEITWVEAWDLRKKK